MLSNGRHLLLTEASPRIGPPEPKLSLRPRLAPIDRLEGQLTFLTQGQYTVRRLINLATERLEDIGELES